MKEYLVVFVMISFAIASGCFASEAPKKGLQIFSPVVQEALSNVASVFNAERDPLEFTSGDIATNCNDYFRLNQEHDVAEGVNNTRIAQDYILCDTLRILLMTKERVFVGVNIESLGNALANNLLIDSYPSSLYQRADTNKNSPRSLLSPSLTVERFAIVSDTADWYYELRIVAVADVDGDEREDWVIWLTDHAKHGNYSVMRVFVALNVIADAPIKLSTF